jgi:signal transduction histidine kinase
MMITSDESLSQQVRDNAGIIAEQASRMTDIIREVLDFSKRKPLERVNTRVGDVLQHAVSLMEPVCEDKGIAIELRGDQDATADLDSGKTLQVLTNLMMNSMHAMPNGGLITLSVERTHVADPRDRHASAGQFVKIGVEDEGVGIPKDRLDDIFKAFFTTKKDRGTGLGLSVCHGIVREHGGFIDVSSELGKGTQFSVFLPEEAEQ